MAYGKWRILGTWTAGLVMAGMAGFLSPGTAGARQATGAPPAYTLRLQALLNSGNSTDVSITVVRTSASFAIPGVAKQILLKSYADDGVTVFWAKTYSNVPLDAQGTVRYRFPDLLRHQPLRALVVIQTAQMVNAQVYRVDGRVLDRPDLAVQSLSAPTQVMMNKPVNVQASIHETLGDLGAVSDVVLLDSSNQVLDSATAVSVGPGGTVGVVLTTQFPAPGSYTLTVAIRNSNPTEFDAANDQNNQANITITVVATIPTEYFALYSDFVYDFENATIEWNYLRTSLRTASKYFEAGQRESFGYNAWFSTPLAAAGFSIDVQADHVSVLSASIPLGNPTSTKSFDDHMGNSFTAILYAMALDPGGTDWLFFSSQSGTGVYSTPFSNLSVEHFASEFKYFSATFKLLYGWQFSSGGAASGSFWQARSTIHTEIWVIAGDGTQYGGRSDTALIPSQQDVGPTSTVKADPILDFYFESTELFHSQQWSGSSSGTTY
jgi:hypothetical protein